ncbi:hypothetical protein FKM52_19285 [Mixta tenebrionis]|uniref:Uncharacterized protein n=1 Tax=Mixta tenebrionis TaxID=2562439 RepID=A0A506V0J5_9GAMM|nr:hypothetical protein FKM52_19285 [Mixta tenebrionis]
MLSKTGFTHSDLLHWQIEYAGSSLNVNGTMMWDTYPARYATVRKLITRYSLLSAIAGSV